jgi:DNA-binding LacI/PurR family transcriptional regulator
MHGDAANRPDALIITDDNLVEHAQAGLIAAGIRVPDQVEVVEHCNFPWPPSVLGTKRLGFDSHAILRACIDLIDRQRRNETVPGMTLVPAIFEEELAVPAAP